VGEKLLNRSSLVLFFCFFFSVFSVLFFFCFFFFICCRVALLFFQTQGTNRDRACAPERTARQGGRAVQRLLRTAQVGMSQALV
jgi:hypothetical protein